MRLICGNGYIANMESRTSRLGRDPKFGKEAGGSRMLCADKLWRLGGHDPYSLIMIHHFGCDPSGNQSAARNGDGNAKHWGENPVMFLGLEQPDDSFLHIN